MKIPVIQVGGYTMGWYPTYVKITVLISFIGGSKSYEARTGHQGLTFVGEEEEEDFGLASGKPCVLTHSLVHSNVLFPLYLYFLIIN